MCTSSSSSSPSPLLPAGRPMPSDHARAVGRIWHEFQPTQPTHTDMPYSPSCCPPAAVAPVVQECLHALPSAPDSHHTGVAQSPTQRDPPRLSRAGSARGPLYLRPTRRPGMQIEHQHQSTIVLSHNTSPLRPTSLFGSPPSSLTSLFAWLEVNANPESDLRDVREMTVDQRLPGHWRLRWRWWCGGWRRWHNGWRHPR